MRTPFPSVAIAICLSVIVACGSTGGGDIVDDDGGLDVSDDTAHAADDAIGTTDTTSRDVVTTDVPAADVSRPDTATSADTRPGEAAVDSPFADKCTGVATAPLIPPTTCNGPGGNTTKEIPSNRVYSSSWFGCYRKADGTIYKDPTDNCLFACGNKGLCSSALTGPECEANLKWFAADADRYGCGGRIRVTNCVNRRSVILVTLDRGPNCKTVEQTYSAPAIDMSYPAMTHLYEGKLYGVADKKRLLVEAVADTTPLGPE